MKRETLSAFTLILLFISVLLLNLPQVKAAPSHSLINEAFLAPDVPRGHNSSNVPGYYETSEYLIGSVAVGIVLLESNGTIDPSTEDWTSSEESMVINEITTGLNWWKSQNPSAGVSFTYNVHYGVPTRYEPISHAGPDDAYLWISEAVSYLGYPGTSYFTQIRDYVNELRDTSGTNWSFAIFVVDSSNDPDGCFTGWTPPPTRRWSAWAALGGPYFVLTYDNDGYGIWNMDYVAAHEMGHIFYATDEYNGRTETSGYLGVQDHEGSGCMMCRALSWWLCRNSREQVGWRDSDGDGIQDIVDTFPKTLFSISSSNVDESHASVTYNGFVSEVPYPNRNPSGTGRDLTINIITNVEFKLDNETWTEATATDGVFDEAEEMVTFSSRLPFGLHILSTRADNSIGNTEVSYLGHEVGQISAATSFKTPRDDLVTIIVDKTTFQVLATRPSVIEIAINIFNVDFSHEMNSVTAFYLIPLDWKLDPNSVQAQLFRVGHGVRAIPKTNRITTFESNILIVDIPDITAAVGDPLGYGDNLIISFKLGYTIRNATLSDDYAWSDKGPIYYFSFASEPIRTKLKWVLGPPWVWKRP